MTRERMRKGTLMNVKSMLSSQIQDDAMTYVGRSLIMLRPSNDLCPSILGEGATDLLTPSEVTHFTATSGSVAWHAADCNCPQIAGMICLVAPWYDGFPIQFAGFRFSVVVLGYIMNLTGVFTS